MDTATKQLVGDLRLAHGSATNQFTDWRIMLTLDRAEAEEGPDYYLVGLAGPYGPSGTRPSADRRLPRTLPSNVKTTNVLTPSGPSVDDAEAAYWVAPWDAALRATEAGRDYDEARAGAGQTARSGSRPEAGAGQKPAPRGRERWSARRHLRTLGVRRGDRGPDRRGRGEGAPTEEEVVVEKRPVARELQASCCLLALLNPLLTVLSSEGLTTQVNFASLGTIHGGVRMISREETVTFVWRCPDCSGAYEGEGLLFLHTDGVNRYCPCGGQLVEGVEPAAERRYRLVIPEHLRGTLLHRQLERREAGEAVEVTVGRLDRHINIFCGN